MEIAFCIIVGCYFAFAFRDVQSVLYMVAVAYVLHMFINNPRLFSNGPASTTHRITTTNNTVHIDQQASVPPSHEHSSPTASSPLTQDPTTPTTPTTVTPISSSRSTPRSPQRKPSRYTFDRINGGVVHSPFGSPKETMASTSILASPSGLRRPHRVPDVSAGKSPVLSASPDSYLPNEHPEPSVAQGEVVNRVVHTEMVTRPRLAVQVDQTTPAEKSPHRRIGSHHHRHHHSHSRSHHRRRSSRSPVSFSDTTGTGSGDHDYDSDSSRASTSSTRSTTSSSASYGLPSYEKHYTMIVTLSPKRAGYLSQIQSIIKAVRPYWLSLPGSVSHEVGHDSEAGTIVIVETYESKDDVLTFERSKEREKMLSRIKPFIEESKTTTTRLPASSAATRYR